MPQCVTDPAQFPVASGKAIAAVFDIDVTPLPSVVGVPNTLAVGLITICLAYPLPSNSPVDPEEEAATEPTLLPGSLR